MGKGDNRRGTTRELDAVKLSALQKASKSETAPKVPIVSPAIVSRASTRPTTPVATKPAPPIVAPRVAVVAPPRLPVGTERIPPVVTVHEQPVALGRAATLDDPLTTGLLAEVARQSQTQEFDDEVVEEIQTSQDKKSG